MSHGKNIAKNSLWLIVQPLVLNIISLFVIGYIARTLGQMDYGKFVFAFAFVSIFVPLTNMGLDYLTTREIAENKENAGIILGKILLLRIALALIAVAVVVIVIILLGYPPNTRLIVYIAATTLLLNAVSTTVHSAFQGFEKMEYVAYSQFISGFVLTVLSVVVLFFGYRLTGITSVYAFGNLLGMVIAIIILVRKIAIPIYSIDIDYWKKSIVRGLPFLLPAIVSIVGSRIGIIILSKMSGDVAVGNYGAANGLIEKLLVIPAGIGTAVFPTIAVLYQNSKEDAGKLFERIFLYLVLIAFPIAVGVTVLAKPIIVFIYGTKYTTSILTLQILSWWLFLTFVNSLQGLTLSAIHKEKKGALVTFIVTPIYILLNLLIIPYFNAVGVALASFCSSLLGSVLLSVMIRRYLTVTLIKPGKILKIAAASALMGALIFVLKSLNVILIAAVGAIFYLLLTLLFKIIDKSDINKILDIFLKRNQTAAEAGGNIQ